MTPPPGLSASSPEANSRWAEPSAPAASTTMPAPNTSRSPVAFDTTSTRAMRPFSATNRVTTRLGSSCMPRAIKSGSTRGGQVVLGTDGTGESVAGGTAHAGVAAFVFVIDGQAQSLKKGRAEAPRHWPLLFVKWPTRARGPAGTGALRGGSVGSMPASPEMLSKRSASV